MQTKRKKSHGDRTSLTLSKPSHESKTAFLLIISEPTRVDLIFNSRLHPVEVKAKTFLSTCERRLLHLAFPFFR
jgi:hypothetical protein